MEIPAAISTEGSSSSGVEQPAAVKEVRITTPKSGGVTKSHNDTPLLDKSKHASMVLFV